MDQEWFEMKDIRRRNLAAATWIPLRAARAVERVGKFGFVGFREDWLGTRTLAVSAENRSDAFTLNWDDIGTGHNHAGCVDNGRYIPADVYEDFHGRFTGVHLVLNQRGGGAERPEWHLHQDFVTTLGLTRERDTWLRPDENYIQVARLIRASDGSATLLEAHAAQLRDYLCARSMGLVVSSYRERSEIIEDASHISWAADNVEEKGEHDRWVGRRMAMHEGGEPYGESVFVTHVSRTDVNPEDDVPVLGLPTDANLQSSSWTGQFRGRKLYRILGELWRTEWLEPASQSPIVRGDKLPASVSFIIDAEGKRATTDALVESGRWLWFRPTLVPALIDRRGGSLKWYTRDTGAVACSPHYDVHFGINAIGLVNTYAKDVALLPEWQQREWAAHNVNPNGKMSEELKASHVDATPASTHAPEAFLIEALGRLQTLAQAKLKITLRRQHDYVAELIPRIHRFRATDRKGLFALAKDLARITADDIDERQLQTIVSPPKGEHWRSLKSLEKLLASKIDPADARKMMGALVGVYELRLADAHLPSDAVDDAMRLIGVDDSSPFVMQGYQLIHAAVAAIYQIGTVIEAKW